MDYERLQAGASRQLREHGMLVTVTMRQPGVFDPATQTITAAAPVQASVYAVLSKYSEEQVNGTTVLAGDQLLLTEPTISPQVGDSVDVGGTILKIVNSTPVKPAGVVLLHKLQVRA